MNIINLSQEQYNAYFCCLEEWSDEIKEGGAHKELWFEKMKDKGLRVKLALNDAGQPAGMIQYVPIEYANASGEGLYFILCIWVHKYKEGVCNNRHKGMGKALLQAAEEDAKALGAKGLVAWGMMLPVFMRASFFRRHGYKKCDRNGIALLLWKPFTGDAVAPKWIKPKLKPVQNEGIVTVTSFLNGWCPAMNMVHERAKRAAAEFPDKVKFDVVNTLNPETFNQWGIMDGLYIDGKAISTGPPPAYLKILKKVAKKVNRLS